MPAVAKVPSDLPDNIAALKALIQTQATEHERRIAQYQTQISTLQEQLNLLLAKRFGPSSEQVSPDQLRLFNEAEHGAGEIPVEEDETDTVTVPEHTRQKRGRKPLPKDLPRVRVEHDLPGDQKTCACGCGLTRIGEAVSEQLDIIPARVQVLRHVRFTYACKGCEETIQTAALPPQPLPKSNAAPGLLAHIAVAKYQDALPLHRQEKILQRIGVDIPRATLANWMIKLGSLIEPLIDRLQETLRGYDILGMDETTIQVLKEHGRSATSTSYLWVQRGGPPERPVVRFHYDPGRGREVAAHLLKGYRGYVQTDGYEVYETVANGESSLIRVGCLAHARRKFDEALKAQGKHKTKAGKAMLGLSFIQKLYRIEKAQKEATPEQRHQARQHQAKPILAELRAWLDKSLPEVPPTSATGKALGYLHRQWPSLIRYLDDGRLDIDNNATERAIRPFVIGRRNWLFSDTPRGATASANLYSLIETAKLNGLEPYHYLRHVFRELPAARTLEQIEALLPYNLDPADLADTATARKSGVG